MRLVVCPFCPEGVHTHSTNGYHAPGCSGPRARYLVRGLAPAAYVRLLLRRRLGFQAQQVSEIMHEIACAPRCPPDTRAFKCPRFASPAAEEGTGT